MSSIFSSKANKANESKKTRRRSSSVSDVSRFHGSKKSEQIDFSEFNDVSTHICTETAKAILVNPDVRTGAIFKTIERSQRDINKSDTTIIMTAAILGHIGNAKMEQSVLGKSSTCRGLYRSLGLEDEKIRGLFVIMMFSLNPNFATMINSTLKVAIDRASREVSGEYSENQLVNSIKQLAFTETIKNDEISSISSDTIVTIPKFKRDNSSLQTTPTEMIHPDDSVTTVGSIPRRRRHINDTDMMEYINRRKSGHEPEFSEVFKNSSPPIAMQNKRNKHGLGFHPSIERPQVDPAELVRGRKSVESVNLSRGKVNRRVPKVEDATHYSYMSETAAREVPMTTEEVWADYDFKNNMRAPRTESFLPDSDTFDDNSTVKGLKQKDSAEFLLASLGLG